MKPIETHYDGYRFRSRLEARWAVFFKKAGIPYSYEIEGFVVKDKPYLPDFYLPWYDCYMEVKPLREDEDTIEFLKEFSKTKPVILVQGDPYVNHMTLFEDGDSYRCTFAEGCKWGDSKCPFGYSKHWVTLLCNTRKPELKTKSACGLYQQWEEEKVKGDFLYYRSILQGYRKASREARFEHGEKP